eukprot:TRINITY_DN25638_c0_g1_i1.p1 TRINITY_DN25638_c0_g1~~TRINITY_DN25638_c0_g1_i1.p1  ORF type:complete len:576 (-),score=106.68 TRINITY_DN25638_c0_g1_i1:14-1741(-)
MATRTEDFQRNTAFSAFMLLICLVAFVTLTKNLRETLVPLIWAAFFAVPSILMIDYIDGIIVHISSYLKRACGRARGRPPSNAPDSLEFMARMDQHGIVITGAAINGNDAVQGSTLVQATSAFLQKVNRPCFPACATFLRWMQLQSCFRRRVRITRLSVEAESSESSDLGPEVNRFVEGWNYYVSDQGARTPGLGGEASAMAPLAAEDAEGGGELRLELYLDAAETYPAVLPHDLPDASDPRRVSGTLQIDKTSSVTWSLALVGTLLLAGFGCWIFVESLILGVASFAENMGDYKKGIDEFLKLIKPLLPDSAWEELSKKAQSFISDEIPQLASQFVASVEALGFQALMFFVYLFFWIFEPLPISGPVAQVFKSYLFLKTTVCLLFASLMSVLLICLRCKIWSLFFVLTFLLNYIPEIGAIGSAVLMVPAVLLDGHLPMETRLVNLFWLVIFGTGIKIFTGNVVEVQMYASMGGQFMRMHPVVIMAFIMLFSALLGTTGMFLAVPIMAAVKYYLLAADMPTSFLHPLLVFIEGDETSPHKNHVDQQRMNQRDQARTADVETAGSQLELAPGQRQH